jgi:mRNA interferase RelE/StbE
MKPWSVEFTPDAKADRAGFDVSQKGQIDKAIYKVAKNPLPQSEGGYGKPLGNKRGQNLTGLLKIKLLKIGIRIVYKIVRDKEIMRIIVIAARKDDEVYDIAAYREGL